ncbi:MAG: DUF1905 domain-containing protein [Acidobacteria bacterium]|nr:DUF1905 domain-containing protein [Acidobacteriota bacterium]MBI3427027.1 DUF1905 domain-containing protein [Acidobacteriota bacterium]
MSYRFIATIYKFSSNPSFCCVDVPAELSAAVGKKGAASVVGTVNGLEWRGNLLPNGKGGHRMILNGQIRKQARAGVGDAVEISLQADEAARALQLPEELAEALRENDLLDKFNALPPSHQRHTLQWLQSAKTRPTWERRVETLVMRLTTNNWRQKETP